MDTLLLLLLLPSQVHAGSSHSCSHVSTEDQSAFYIVLLC